MNWLDWLTVVALVVVPVAMWWGAVYVEQKVAAFGFTLACSYVLFILGRAYVAGY